MQGLTAFLRRFSSLESPEKVVTQAVLPIVRDMVHSSINSENIEYQNTIVFVRGGNALKQVIAVKRIELLAKIQEAVGGRYKISDVR